LLEHIFTLPGAVPGVPENVFQTLPILNLRVEVEKEDGLILFSCNCTVIRAASPKDAILSSSPEGNEARSHRLWVVLSWERAAPVSQTRTTRNAAHNPYNLGILSRAQNRTKGDGHPTQIISII
jgi:hypothetical protein